MSLRGTWKLPVALALSLAVACSGSEAEPSATPTATESESPEPDTGGVEAAAYVTAICDRMVSWIGDIQTLNQELLETSSGASSVEQVKQAAVLFFGGLVEATNGMIDDIESAGVPDVPRGEEAARHILDGLREARGSMQDARQRVADLPTGDPQAFGTSLQEITTEMARQLSSVGTSMEEFAAPELDAAANDVAACQDFSI
jgi:hypothetical protein